MAKSGFGIGDLLLWGGVAFGGWWLYENYWLPSVAAATPATPVTPAGSPVVNSSGAAPITCQTGYTLTNGSCVQNPLTSCPTGYDLVQGQCLPPLPGQAISAARASAIKALASPVAGDIPATGIIMPGATVRAARSTSTDTAALSGLGWARSMGAYV